METTFAKLGEGTALARELGDDVMIGRFLDAEGYTAFMHDDLARAQSLLEESLALAEGREDRMATAIGHHGVAQVARLDGRLADAAQHYRLALEFAYEVGGAAAVVEPMQGLAAVAIATGDPDRGVRLLAASDAIREQLGSGPPPEWLRLGDPLADARRSPGAEAYQLAWEAGRTLTVDEGRRRRSGGPSWPRLELGRGSGTVRRGRPPRPARRPPAASRRRFSRRPLPRGSRCPP